MWIEALGGRKFVITVMGVVSVVLLAKWNATGDAFTALGFMVASFAAANSAVSWKGLSVSGSSTTVKDDVEPTK